MKRQFNRFFAMLLVVIMVISNMNLTMVLADDEQDATYPGAVTSNLEPLLTGIVLKTLDGTVIQPNEDGVYDIPAKTKYILSLSFAENNALEMDMTGSDSVTYRLPAGISATNVTSGTIDIGVIDGSYQSINHGFDITNNVVTITWDKTNPYFRDLSFAHGVSFSFSIEGEFEGTQDEIDFGAQNDIKIKVDNSGFIIITKNVTGLKSDTTLTEADMKAMTFELRNSSGEVVRTFSYWDMRESGSITFDKMRPGEYSVVETKRPEITLYTFDEKDSTTERTGTLPIAESLNLALTNDYEYDKGSLELSKVIDCSIWDPMNNTWISDDGGVIGGISFTIEGPYGYSKTLSYSQFENGKYTLENLDVGTYRITENGTVDGYTWSYSIKVGDTVVETQASAVDVIVEKGKTAKVSFENTYVQKTGSLVITKTASGAAVPADTEFTVTGPNGYRKTFKYSDMTNGSYTISPIPYGIYTVTENSNSAQVASYSLTVTGGGTVNVNGDNTSTTINNAYSPQGNLRINKKIAGDLQASDLTVAQQRDIKFTVKNAQGRPVGTLSYYDILRGNDTFTNLPVGTYTVEESARTITGYTMTASSTRQTATVTVGETVEVFFTNSYSQDEYKVTVLKEFADGSYYDIDNLPTDISENTTFTITKEGEASVTCKLTELANVLNECVFRTGGEITITETNPSRNGLVISTSVSKDGGTTYNNGNSVTVTLVNHQTVTVRFKNNYELQGKIKVDKTVEGLTSYDEAALRSRITFTIYSVDENGSATPFRSGVTLADLEKGIVVPAGKYYLDETGNLGVNGYSEASIHSQVENGEIKEDSESQAFDVGQNSTVTVHYTNTYTQGPGRGTLLLTKYVRGLAEIGSPERIVLTNSLAVYNTKNVLLYNGISFKIEEKIGNTWYEFGAYSLQTLLTGGVSLRDGHYRMTEQDANVNGYSLNVDFLLMTENAGTIVQNTNTQIEFEMKGSSGIKIQLTNVYTPLGNLSITKTISGIQLSRDERTQIVFEVTGPAGFTPARFTLQDIYDAASGTGVKTFTGIPVGTYTIKEIASDTGTYTLTTTSNLSSNGTTTVVFGETTDVTITNTYTRMLGNLKITKKFAGEVPDTLTPDQEQAMVFSVLNSSNQVIKDTNGNDVTVSYADFTNRSYTFTGIPTGTYTVVETIGGELTNSYQVNVTGNNQTANITAGNTVEVEITNTFVRTGSLKLKKLFGGTEISGDLKETIQFRYWKINDDGTTTDPVTISYSDFNSLGEYTVNHLVPGQYVVEECDDLTGYKRTTTVTVGDDTQDGTEATVEITFGNTATVSFTNTYEGIASLVITKRVTGEDLLNAFPNLTEEQQNQLMNAMVFTVKDAQGEVLTNAQGETIGIFTYADMSVYADGTRTMTFSNLVPGEYTVEEKVDDTLLLLKDYTWVTEYQIGAATATEGAAVTLTVAHGDNNVTFTNTFTAVKPLTVVKHSSDSYVGMVSKENIKYPVWEFTLNISELNLHTTTGATTLQDVYDAVLSETDTVNPEWFRLATEAEVTALGLEGVTQNYSLRSSVDGKEAPAVRFTDNGDGTATIYISGITDNTADKCTLTYYLIVKDKSVLDLMNKPASETESTISLTFNNKVTYQPWAHKDEQRTTEATYTYRFEAVSKEILNAHEDGTLYLTTSDGREERVNYVEYSVTLNKDGIWFGDSTTEYLTATDRFSRNQTIIYSSIHTDPEVPFKLDNTAHTLEITIPNATPVTVTYRVNINDNVDEGVSLWNNIHLKGFVDGVEETVFRLLSGSGSGTIYSIKLIKVDSESNNMMLQGVTFSLYDGANDQYLTRDTTNEKGLIQFKYWGANGSFKVDHNYYLVEDSTIPGYNLNSSEIWFRISDTDEPGVYTREKNPDFFDRYDIPDEVDQITVLINSQELLVTNEPVVANIEVTKEFNDWTEQNSFQFALTAVDGAPMPDGSAVLEGATAEQKILYATAQNPTVNFGHIRYTVADDQLPVTYYYTIQEVIKTEDMVDGILYDTTKHNVTVVISDEDEDGVKEVKVFYDNKENQTSLTVTNVYELVNINGTKTWDDVENQDGIRPSKLKFYLWENDGTTPIASREVIVDTEGRWSFSFENLPKYKNNTLVTYTVTEEIVEGYTTSYKRTIDEDGNITYAFSNTHTPKVVEISVTKTWNDFNDQDGYRRPVTFALYRQVGTDDVEQIATLTLNGEENTPWSGKFVNPAPLTYADDSYAFAKYMHGIPVVYTVKELDAFGNPINPATEGEELPVFYTVYYHDDEANKDIVVSDSDYTVSYDSRSTDNDGNIAYAFSNTHVPEFVKISIKKVWDDANNQDGKRRPVTFALYYQIGENGEEQPYTYMVGEKKVTLTLTLNGEETASWSGQFINPAPLTYADDSYAFAKYMNGQRVIYTVKELDAEGKPIEPVAENENEEVDLSGFYTVVGEDDIDHDSWYSVSYDGQVDADGNFAFTFTNQHIPETIDISVLKIWDDVENQDGKRPEEIVIGLYAKTSEDGSMELFEDEDYEIESIQILTAATEDENGNELTPWSFTFKDLPKYKDGFEIEYEIREVLVEKNVNEDEDTEENDEEAGEVVRLEEQDTFWSVEKDADSCYTVRYDVSVTGAEDALPQTDEDGDITVTITNTHTPETIEISIVKIWDDTDNQDGKRPEMVVIGLYAKTSEDGSMELFEDENYETESVQILNAETEDEDGNELTPWSFTFNGLPKYKDGFEIEYEICEILVEKNVSEDGDPEEEGEEEVGEETGNETGEETSNETGEETGNETGEEDDEVLIYKVLKKLAGEDNGFWTVENDADSWYTVTYDVTVTGAENELPQDDEDGDMSVVITNTHVPEVVEIPGTKTWDDANNQDGIRPETITVRLWADIGEDDEFIEIDHQIVEVDEDGNWSYIFTDDPEGLRLFKYKEGKVGELVTYFVTEDEVDGYDGTITEFDIVNKHNPETVEVSGKKTWVDNNNQDGVRPESITVRLYADGVEIDHLVVKPDEDGNWTYSFTELPKYKVGAVRQAVTYTVTEDKVEGYTTVIDGYNITNTHEVEKTSVSATKTWSDQNDLYRRRPESIVLVLYANGVATDKKITLSEENNWKGVFTNLDVYSDGKVIEYTVEEELVWYYFSVVSGDMTDGFSVVNIYNPRRTPNGEVDSHYVEYHKNDKPNTGDSSNTELWFVMMMLGLAGVVTMERMNKAKRED